MDLLDDYSDGDCDSEQETSQKETLKRDSPSNHPITSSKKPKRGNVALILPHELSVKELFERKQPHVQGNWAGHVFITIPNDISAFLASRQQQVADIWKDRLEVDGWTGPMLLHRKQIGTDGKTLGDVHVSLSRPFYLQRGSIDSFVHSLRERLKYKEKGWFRLDCGQTKLLTNDECTRTFLVWNIRDTEGILTALVNDVDAVLERYGAAPYYRPAHFHASVASIPGTCSTVDIHSRTFDEKDQRLVIPVMDVHCTFGTTEEFVIPLGSAIPY